MGEKWDAMTEPVSLEEYAAEADRRLRELADRPMDLSELEIAPYIAGTLRTAAPGDSISSIMGSSDPAAIGAFLQANDLSDTRLRAGQSYLVPEPGSFAAPGARALGQAGLNADNALATQRARHRLDRSMASINRTVSEFNPLGGLLATVPFQKGYSKKASQSAQKHNDFGFEEASGTAGILAGSSKATKGWSKRHKTLERRSSARKTGSIPSNALRVA
jgi:hypothetical protein